MKQIWKYTLSNVRSNTFEMPFYAKVLTVQVQNGVPQLWMLVDLGAMYDAKKTRSFRSYMTGENLPDDPGQYLGTVQMDGGAFVLHIFEIN